MAILTPEERRLVMAVARDGGAKTFLKADLTPEGAARIEGLIKVVLLERVGATRSTVTVRLPADRQHREADRVD